MQLRFGLDVAKFAIGIGILTIAFLDVLFVFAQW
jgi:hypothetical protein